MPRSDEGATGDSGTLVECRGVSKTYESRGRHIRVLDAVDLVLRKGETVVITGRSGTGKSTLLNLLGGLERPTSGSIIFKGIRLEDMSGARLARLRRQRIGTIFQSFNLLASWTAMENVDAALLHTGMPKAARREKAESLLVDLGLRDRLDSLPAELSGGEQQRVAIARAMANDPALILADEPTGDVDPETASTILDLLTARPEADGKTLVIATHGAVPAGLSARELRLESGKLVATATPLGTA